MQRPAVTSPDPGKAAPPASGRGASVICRRADILLPLLAALVTLGVLLSVALVVWLELVKDSVTAADNAALVDSTILTADIAR